MMSRDPVSPDPNQQEHPRRTLAGAYLRFLTFGVVNVLTFFVASNGIGEPGLPYMGIGGGGLLVVVIALAVWAYVG